MREPGWVLVTMTISTVINIANCATTLRAVRLGCLVVNRVVMDKVRDVTSKQHIEKWPQDTSLRYSTLHRQWGR